MNYIFHFRYPCLQTARILLQCGAAVNGFDALRNTPLHVIVSSKVENNESILDLLRNGGAHLDYANALGQTPADLAINFSIKQLLKCQMNLCLKCLCARLIRKMNVPLRDKIPASLVSFVEKH